MLAIPIQKKTKGEKTKNDLSATQRKENEAVGPESNKSKPAEQSQQPSTSREDERKEIPVKEVEEIPTFSLENDISKLKISIPLSEVMKNNIYKGLISKMLNWDPMLDMVNVEEDQPEMIFGQHQMVSLVTTRCPLSTSV